MTDGRIPAINIAIPAVATGAQSQTEIISLPLHLAQNTAVKGEVTDIKNGQVTIQTEDGHVVLKTDLPLQVGQNINLKLQTVTQNPNGQILTELLLTLDSKGKSTVNNTALPTTRPTQQIDQAVTLSSLAQEFEQAKSVPLLDVDLPDILKDQVQILSAKSIILPQTLTENDLEQLIRTILNLPDTQSLPQTLREGVDKLKSLLPLLGTPLQLQHAQTDSDTLQTQSNLTTLFQPIQRPEAIKALLSQLPNLPVLLTQSIPPGQTTSPEMVAVIKQQVQLLQQSIATQSENISNFSLPNNQPEKQIVDTTKTNLIPQVVKPEQTVEKNLIPTALTNLINKIVPQKTDVPLPLPIPAPMSYQPMLGLALGHASNLITTPQTGTADKLPMLLFMVAPNGQNQITMAMPQNKTNGLPPLVPGTVVMAAMDANAPQVTLSQVLSTLPTKPVIITALHPSLSETWPALNELWQATLQQKTVQPDMLNTLRQTIPMPMAQQMPAAALFFFAILKNGALPHWVGEAVTDQLPLAEKAALVAQLGRDIQTLRAALTDNIPTDAWRPIPMPLVVNDQLYRMQWFFRQQDDVVNDEAADNYYKRKKRTRFLLDVPKTTFGDLQIDGLVQEKSLDVILRTENDLRKPMQDAIQQRYQRALETSGFAGGLIFQAGRQHYIHA